MKRIGTLVQVIHNLRFAGFFFLITVLVFDAALELATCLTVRESKVVAYQSNGCVRISVLITQQF
jgi:hypothetical protein